MKPLPHKQPLSILIVAEQVLIFKETECPQCLGTGGAPICPRCGNEGKIDSETEKVPKQPLTEADFQTFYAEQAALLAKYGLQTDAYGEKGAMLKRLTKAKA